MKKIIAYIGGKLEKLRPKKIFVEKDETIEEKKSESPKEHLEINISARTIIKILLIISLFLIFKAIFIQLSEVITTTIICLFLTLGLSPIVGSFEKKRIPRALAILIFYIVFIGSLVTIFFSVVPVAIEELQGPLQKIAVSMGADFSDSNFFQKMQIWENLGIKGPISFKNIPEIFTKSQGLLGSTFSIVSGIFQGVFNFIYGLVLLFFMLLEREKIAKGILSFFPDKDREYIQKKTERIQEKLKKWFEGQVILMVSVGIFMFIGMKIFEYVFGMQYAGTVAILAGFMELFPYIGITLSSLLALLIAVNISWALVIAVLIWIFITQFLEGNVLVPLVMKKETGLSSVTVMLTLAIGGTLGAAVGGLPLAILAMILAIPIGASVAIFVEEYLSKKNSKI